MPTSSIPAYKPDPALRSDIAAALIEMYRRINEAQLVRGEDRSTEPEQTLTIDVSVLTDPDQRTGVENYGRLAHLANMRLELRGPTAVPGVTTLGGSEMLLALLQGTGAVSYTREEQPSQ